MVNYIYTNSTILLNKINKITSKLQPEKNKKKCSKCQYESDIDYIYKSNIVGEKDINISYLDIHMLTEHNMIELDLYEQIGKTKLDLTYEYILLSTNNINIIDGLYEDGSKEKYIENEKNIYTSKINRYSEHYGIINYKDNKVYNINVFTDMRVDKGDPIIYQPKANDNLLLCNYIYHTHPKTPYLGSRVKDSIIYEFPSIADIIHFIDHHNHGKLLGSLVLAPEGLYIIHKLQLNRDSIKYDIDIFIKEVSIELKECYYKSKQVYNKMLDFSKLMRNNNVKIPENFFYKNISTNFQYIDKINQFLSRYGLFIDFYPRIKLSGTDEWILPDIYLPII